MLLRSTMKQFMLLICLALLSLVTATTNENSDIVDQVHFLAQTTYINIKNSSIQFFIYKVKLAVDCGIADNSEKTILQPWIDWSASRNQSFTEADIAYFISQTETEYLNVYDYYVRQDVNRPLFNNCTHGDYEDKHRQYVQTSEGYLKMFQNHVRVKLQGLSEDSRSHNENISRAFIDFVSANSFDREKLFQNLYMYRDKAIINEVRSLFLPVYNMYVQDQLKTAIYMAQTMVDCRALNQIYIESIKNVINMYKTGNHNWTNVESMHLVNSIYKMHDFDDKYTIRHLIQRLGQCTNGAVDAVLSSTKLKIELYCTTFFNEAQPKMQKVSKVTQILDDELFKCFRGLNIHNTNRDQTYYFIECFNNNLSYEKFDL